MPLPPLSIGLCQATQELQLRLHQGQLVALKTAELFRERDAQRAHRQERSAQRSRQGSLQRSEGYTAETDGVLG